MSTSRVRIGSNGQRTTFNIISVSRSFDTPDSTLNVPQNLARMASWSRPRGPVIDQWSNAVAKSARSFFEHVQ
jgi:hypothetical protein